MVCVWGGEEDWGKGKGAIASYLTVPQCPSHNLAPKTHKYPSLKNAMRITITVTVYNFSIDYLLDVGLVVQKSRRLGTVLLQWGLIGSYNQHYYILQICFFICKYRVV